MGAQSGADYSRVACGAPLRRFFRLPWGCERVGNECPSYFVESTFCEKTGMRKGGYLCPIHAKFDTHNANLRRVGTCCPRVFRLPLGGPDAWATSAHPTLLKASSAKKTACDRAGIYARFTQNLIRTTPICVGWALAAHAFSGCLRGGTRGHKCPPYFAGSSAKEP